MPAMRFDIYFSGKTVQGADLATVRRNLAGLFKTGEEEVTRLMTGDPVRIKSDVDEETAVRYRSAFLKAGALIDVRPVGEAGSPPAAPKKAPKAGAANGLSLLPANTGDLLDCAPRVAPAPIGDISRLTLAPTGSDLDERPPVAPPEIDTGELTLAPAGSDIPAAPRRPRGKSWSPRETDLSLE